MIEPDVVSSGDPLPSIAENAAEGEIAELYADIRKTLDMPFVNLVWRALAAVPGGLSWTWATMKPLYQNGVAHAEARALVEALVIPETLRLPSDALLGVGVDVKGELAIQAALDGYERGNPLNLVTFSAVLAHLRGDVLPVAQNKSPATIPLPPSLRAAPPMMNFDQMSETTAKMVRKVSLLGADEGAEFVQVSLPRNLAYWPGFLALYWAELAPLHEDGSLRDSIDAVLRDGEIRGQRLAVDLVAQPDPGQETLDRVRGILEALIPNAMGRMIPVVALLKNMMPTNPTRQA